MKDWLRKVMEGRYGPDRLGQVLLIAGVVLSIFSNPRGGQWLLLPAYAVLGYSIFRMFSRNYERRRQENEVFLRLWSGISGQAGGFFSRLKQSRQYCFFACPKCGQRLRVPRGRGKLEISCPKCGTQFAKKT